MAEAHIAALLPTQNRVLSADENTALLAHYDLNEHDVFRGVKTTGETKIISLSGLDSGIEIANSAHYSLNKISISMWVYIKSLTTITSFATKRISSSGGFMMFYYYGSTNTITIDLGGSETRWNTGYAPPLNQWIHLAYTHDGTTGVLYVNGNQQATTLLGSPSSSHTASNLFLGRDSSGNSYHFNGMMHNVGLWNRALTANNIKEVMNSNPKKQEGGLIGYWPLNTDSGNIASDMSAFHNDGIITNGTWTTGNSVFTLRPKEGYFGGNAIAVEEGTTNLLTNGHFANGQKIPTETGSNQINEIVRFSNPGNSEWVLRQTDSDGGTVEYEVHPNTPVKPSITYAMSCWVAHTPDWNGATAVFHSRAMSTSGAHTALGGAGTVVTEVVIDGLRWQYQYATLTTPADADGVFNWYVGYNGGNTTGYRYITNLQLEEKPFPTSFVDGTRSEGLLTYPADIINPSQGTISFWVKPHYDFSKVISQATSPKLLQLGGYYENSSLSLWQINTTSGSLTVHTKGVSGTGWSGSFTMSNALVRDQWSMVTLTWNGLSWKGYINGVLKTQMNTTVEMGPISKNTVYFGGDSSGTSAGKKANCLFDELRIDKVERTAEEISAWYYCNSPFWPRGIYRKSY